MNMDTELFGRQVAGHIEMLRWRLKEALKAYEGSKFQKHEEKNIQEFYSHLSSVSEIVREARPKRESYKPHLLRKDECLLEVANVIEALVQWQQCPSNPFPLEQMLWAEQCLTLFHTEQKIPRETAADVIRYNWRVVQLVEGAYRKNNEAIKQKRPLPWSEYRLFDAVAAFIARYPKDYRSKQFLKNGANSGSIKGPVQDAIADRGVSFPSKARNRGRLGKQ
jgi:hypothetical protein